MADVCPRCEDPHPLIRCPYVKAIVFEDSTVLSIRRVEFLTPSDYALLAPRRAPDAAEEPDYPRIGKT
jgi:hypothetical protein